MTSKEIAQKAADILSQPNAWCQGTFRRERPGGGYQYCMMGACREAAGYYAAVDDAYYDYAAVAGYYAASDPATAVWNDTPGRAVDEVVAALRAVP
jgi:hypothetical protein